MNKYVCAGTYVINKSKKTGKVISVDRKSGVVVVQNTKGIWTDHTRNLKVTSYMEVEQVDKKENKA